MSITRADTGLGTTFERISLNKYFSHLIVKYPIETVLEGPTDGIKGIKGINSILLARLGARVTLILPSKEALEYASSIWERAGVKGTFLFQDHLRLDVEEHSFDLVWNFSSLPQVEDYNATIDAMIKASRRFVMIFVSNTKNYGFKLHRLHHIIEHEPWGHGNIEIMDIKKIESILKERRLVIREKVFVDVPWWPDIDRPVGELISSFLPFLKSFVKDTSHTRRYNFDMDSLPYYDPVKQNEMELLYRRHGLFERSSITILKHIFAHHRGILAEIP